jgi:vesicle transport protein SEC22
LLTHPIEKQINRKRKDFRDASAKENIDKLNNELKDVGKIMSESFDMLVNRGRNLN